MYRLAFILLLVLALGCSDGRPKVYPVSGMVVFKDGTSPQFGDIEFFNEELKINARGKIQEDGSFQLGTFGEADGAVAGKHKVIILQRTRNHLTAKIEGMIEHDHGDMLDDKYYDYRTSDLVAEIEPIELNNITLDVKRMHIMDQKKTDH